MFGCDRVIVGTDGRVKIPGLDFEGRKLTVHYRNKKHLVIAVSGGSGWNGVGQPRRYVGAKFIVLEIVKVTSKSKTYMGVTGEELYTADVVEFDLRKVVA